jgi:hypothetical protein
MIPDKEKFDFFQNKYGQRFTEFDSLTASTIDQAFRQLDEDKCGTIKEIVLNNMLPKFKAQEVFDEAKNYMLGHLAYLRTKYGDEEFLNWYNQKNYLRFWLSKYSRNQFYTNRSDFYRQYYLSDKFTYSEELKIQDEEGDEVLSIESIQDESSVDLDDSVQELYDKIIKILQHLKKTKQLSLKVE